MSAPQFAALQANGIRMRVAEQGAGPLVLFCHGWLESWYSWRHQLAALAAAGYRAVAPDMYISLKMDPVDRIKLGKDLEIIHCLYLHKVRT